LLLPLWIGIAILSIFLTITLKIEGLKGPEFIFAGFLLIMAIYESSILAPFRKIKWRVKEAILEEFMKTFHPEMAFSYQQNAATGIRVQIKLT